MWCAFPARAEDTGFICTATEVVPGIMVFLWCADGLYAGAVNYQAAVDRYAGLLVCRRSDTTPCPAVISATIPLDGHSEPQKGLPYPCTYKSNGVECTTPRP
jgi:hypothetical protein